MKIYISGKITGLTMAEAHQQFEKAADRIRAAGHTAINPVSLGALLPGLEWKSYMTMAYGILLDPSVDAVYMLQNWKESDGAVLEWTWAQAKGKRVLYQDPEDYLKYESRREQWAS